MGMGLYGSPYDYVGHVAQIAHVTNYYLPTSSGSNQPCVKLNSFLFNGVVELGYVHVLVGGMLYNNNIKLN